MAPVDQVVRDPFSSAQRSAPMATNQLAWIARAVFQEVLVCRACRGESQVDFPGLHRHAVQGPCHLTLRQEVGPLGQCYLHATTQLLQGDLAQCNLLSCPPAVYHPRSYHCCRCSRRPPQGASPGCSVDGCLGPGLDGCFGFRLGFCFRSHRYHRRP